MHTEHKNKRKNNRKKETNQSLCIGLHYNVQLKIIKCFFFTVYKINVNIFSYSDTLKATTGFKSVLLFIQDIIYTVNYSFYCPLIHSVLCSQEKFMPSKCYRLWASPACKRRCLSLLPLLIFFHILVLPQERPLSNSPQFPLGSRARFDMLGHVHIL